VRDPYLAKLCEDIEAECLAQLAAERLFDALPPLSPFEQALARVDAHVSHACWTMNEFISNAFWPMAEHGYMHWIMGLCFAL